MNRLFAAITGVALLCVTVGQVRADLIVSTFDTNTEGWTLFGDAASLTHFAAGGNPGGFIRATDLQFADVWYFKAPAKFLGDKSLAYDQILSFDLRQTGTGTQFNATDVVLNGGGLQIAIDAGTNPLPVGDWVSYGVLLSESAGWLKVSNHEILSGGVPVTQAEMLTVLGSLTQMRIRGEFIAGSDMGRLDNVAMNVVPEPSSFALFAVGVACFVGIRFRRWREIRQPEGESRV
jgi:hypothetical protein